MGSSRASNSDRKENGAAWTSNLRMNEYIDVLDTTDKWTEAVVIGISQHKVHVHYRGWPTKFNEWIPVESQRLAPAYSKVHNWRALKKGDRVQLSTDVNGVKEPVWRDGTIHHVRHGDTTNPVPAKVKVILDGDREHRWVHAQDDSLAAPGTHRVPRPVIHLDGDDDGDDENDGDTEKHDTIELSDNERSGSSGDDGGLNDRKFRRSRGPITTRAKALLTRSTTKQTSTPARPPSGPRVRRDNPMKLPTLKKRKHDDDDFATWREGLSPGAELEVADAKQLKWYEARVCAVRGKREIRVRFRGWPYRCDEWLPRSSMRIAPTATHLGRWRDFAENDELQIGFRASASADRPSHWVQGIVTKVTKTKQSRRIKQIQVQWESDDGEVRCENRDPQDDLLAPLGAITYPLPTSTGDGGPEASRSADDEDEDGEHDEIVDNGIDLDENDVEMVICPRTKPEDTRDSTHDREPLADTSLSEIFSSLTPADIHEAIASHPPDMPLEATGTTPTTLRGRRTARARKRFTQELVAALDSFKESVVAAVDAALGAWPSSTEDDGEVPAKRVRRPRGDESGAPAAGVTATPATRAMPEEI